MRRVLPVGRLRGEAAVSGALGHDLIATMSAPAKHQRHRNGDQDAVDGQSTQHEPEAFDAWLDERTAAGDVLGPVEEEDVNEGVDG